MPRFHNWNTRKQPAEVIFGLEVTGKIRLGQIFAPVKYLALAV